MQPRREMSHRTCCLLHGFRILQSIVISLMDYVRYLRMESRNVTDAWEDWSRKQDDNNANDWIGRQQVNQVFNDKIEHLKRKQLELEERVSCIEGDINIVANHGGIPKSNKNTMTFNFLHH